MKTYLSIFLVTFITIAPLYSQVKLEEIENTVNDNISISDTNQVVRALLLGDNHYIPKAKKDRIYYWFNNNKIFTTQGGYGGRLLHGEYISYYTTHQLKEKGLFKFGLKEGIWQEWYPNGNLKSSYTWKKGQQNGSYMLYSADGKLEKSGKYRKGRQIN